jgi:putative SOS response-associated peptidase YedK
MCRRYVSPDTAAIEGEWHIRRGNSNPFRRRLNVIAPTQIPIIRCATDFDELELLEARWGFAPGWWKKPRPPVRCFVARSEEAAVKPIWRYSYSRARCLIPAEGWYGGPEADITHTSPEKIRTVKQPHFIYRQDRRPVSIAGLMSVWYPSADCAVLTCAIVTRSAAPSVSDVQDRMPVILGREAGLLWVNPAITAADDVASIVACAETEFVHHPVTTHLNPDNTDEPQFASPA